MLQTQQAKVAVYARRSPEDKMNRQNTFRDGGVTDSIESQLLELGQYAREQGFTSYREYYDDNISGTTFARPHFMEMLEDIQAGTVDTVIVKDLSRLGRDYIESGRYQETVFPELGVRLIAINDGYDSGTGAGTDTAPFKNLFNDWYVRDISRKTKSALAARAKSGKYLSTGLYGYQKAPEDKNQLIPDPNTAPVVQRIFSMAAGGHSFRSIARQLAADEILTPAAYKGLEARSAATRPTDWSPITVAHIVREPQYLGKVVFGRKKKASYKSKKLLPTAEVEQIVVEGTHEPLVSVETWNLANEVCQRQRKSTQAGEPHMFAGLLYCADCGSTMVHSGHGAFVCQRYRNYSRGPQGCASHRITDAFLYDVVWNTVKAVIREAEIDRAGLVERLTGESQKKQKAALDAAVKEQRRTEKRLGEIGALVKKAFEKNATGALPDDVYRDLMADYTAERGALTAKLDNLTAQVVRLEKDTGNAEKFVALVEQYIGVEALDRELVHALIDRIDIGESYKTESGYKVYPVEVTFRFVGKIKPFSF